MIFFIGYCSAYGRLGQRMGLRRVVCFLYYFDLFLGEVVEFVDAAVYFGFPFAGVGGGVCRFGGGDFLRQRYERALFRFGDLRETSVSNCVYVAEFDLRSRVAFFLNATNIYQAFTSGELRMARYCISIPIPFWEA